MLQTTATCREKANRKHKIDDKRSLATINLARGAKVAGLTGQTFREKVLRGNVEAEMPAAPNPRAHRSLSTSPRRAHLSREAEMTDANETDGARSTMRRLTPKQEAFAQIYIEISNASEAYRQAYNAGNMRLDTIHVKASQLLKNDKVAVRLAELREGHRKRHEVSVDSIIKELDEARALARASGMPAAMVAASMGKAKLCGLVVDKQQHTGRDGQSLVAEVPATRDLAKAVLSLLREAGLGGQAEVGTREAPAAWLSTLESPALDNVKPRYRQREAIPLTLSKKLELSTVG